MATPSDNAEVVAFPPFDATTFGSQLFWFAIVFTTLYVMISRVIAPRIAGIIEDRRARIANDLAEAGKMQARAQTAGEAHEKALADARANAQKIAQDTRNKLNADADAKRKSLESELSARLVAAEKQVAEMKAKALGNVETVAADATAAIVEKLLGKAPSADAVAAAVKTATAR